MKTREEAVQYALTFPDVYRDEPFHDLNWTVIRKKKAGRCFSGYLKERDISG